MIDQHTLTRYLNEQLAVDAVSDYTINGLQVEGCHEIQRVVTGVTACQALIDEACRVNADALLVHHGFFWKNEPPAIVGPKKKRIAALINHRINLYAYHLPLDIHPELGNNARLGALMNWTLDKRIDVSGGLPLVNLGHIDAPTDLIEINRTLAQTLGREPLMIPGGEHQVRTIAWCTGAGQDFIELAAAQGADLFVTGEVSERTTHMARELGVHFIAAGHHATERDGVKALGRQLSHRFDLSCQFVNIENPV